MTTRPRDGPARCCAASTTCATPVERLLKLVTIVEIRIEPAGCHARRARGTRGSSGCSDLDHDRTASGDGRLPTIIGAATELIAEQTFFASSPLAARAPPDRAAVLTTAAERRWIGAVSVRPRATLADIDGDESWGNVRPAFAAIDTASGLLGVAAAVSGYFGGEAIQSTTPTSPRGRAALAGGVGERPDRAALRSRRSRRGPTRSTSRSAPTPNSPAPAAPS